MNKKNISLLFSLKKILFFSLVLVPVSFARAQKAAIKTFPLSAVKILKGPFQEAEQTDLKYILSLNTDRLLAPYLREAGIDPKADSYGNWENTGLDGHIGGHYLTALAEMTAAGNKEAFNRLTYMVDWLERCQKKNGNGYVGGIPKGKEMWEEIARGKIDAGSFSLNKRWVPLYNIHKTFAGLRDAYVIAGNEKAKTILIGLTDWFLNLTSKLTDEQVQTMLKSEHGGLNEVFADITEITGERKYLDLARRFSDRAILKPLLAKKDELNGLHANTQIPKVIGFIRVAQVSGDQDWLTASSFFWNTVVTNRTVSIGGNSVREHFNPSADFSSMIESREGPETCNSYNMLKLSKQLFLSDPSAKYIDYYERTTYNHILSSQHPEGGFVYFTPIRPRHYRVYSQAQQSFWCCVGSGLENHGKYGELIYAHDDKNLYVNLFVPSTITWKEKGLLLTQNTGFPFEERTSLKVTLTRPSKFAIKLRYPSWVEEGKMKVFVNDKEVAINKDHRSYLSIDRTWKSGDMIYISLPMATKAEHLPDKSSWVSFVHGPIVLAAVTDSADLTGLKADDSRMGHVAHGPLYPLDNAPLLVAETSDLASSLKRVDGEPLTFTASELIYEKKWKNLQLKPFYTVHDARYVLYWPYTSREKLPEIQKAMKRREDATRQLEAITVDLVNPGEQQPESDHNFKGEESETGIFRERHYRTGKGWFSYDLRNSKSEARRLRFTYYGVEADKNFDVMVNGVLLTTMAMAGSEGDKFVEKVIDLPQSVLQHSGNTLQVKFKAKDRSSIARIFELRLLK